MDKHLSRTHMLFSLGFIFTLALAVGSFFAGVEIGSNRTEAIYQAKKLQASAASKSSYTQQDLVSFYHTVFSPYREFVNEWLLMEKKAEAGTLSPSASPLKHMKELAAEKRKEIASSRIASSNSLLASAKAQILASLDDAAKLSTSKAAEAPAESFLHVLRSDELYRAAAQQGLNAEQNYYASMLKWASTTDSALPDHAELDGTLTIKAWTTYPLLVKTKLIDDLMNKTGRWTEYYPQDMAGAIDELIHSGEADRLKASTINELIELLTTTNAVRSGEFWTFKSKLYPKETLPQLPFFLAPSN